MLEARIVMVAVEKAAYHFDKLYSYYLPEGLGTVSRGCRVMVPFGGGNRRCQGIVIVCDTKTDFRKLKPVFAILDEQPLFSEELLKLAQFVKERTFCSLFTAAYAMLPPGLYMKIKPCYEAVTPRDPEAEAALAASARQVLSLLDKAPEGVFEESLLSRVDDEDPKAVLESLVKQGMIRREDVAKRLMVDATVRMVRPTLVGDELKSAMVLHKCTDKQRALLTLLEESGAASVKELCYFAGVTTAVLSAVQRKGLVEIYDSERLRSPVADTTETLPPIASVTLSNEQQTVFEGLQTLLNDPAPQAALLHGVTGSGKTQVYMNLIDRTLENGRQALVLVPEISLTPQMMRLFLGRYGRRVALLHSGLSLGERMDEWKRVHRGEASIVLGTRSAVFAPLTDIGLIVMDEEQEHTYKSDTTPRYHTKDVVRFRAAQHGALMLLCSATPSVESYYHALCGRYHLFTLASRFGEAGLPQVQVVDMREEPMSNGVFSDALCQALETCFADGKQAILLYNRRGYHTFVSCRSCGHVITCPSCSISMTYHGANDRMICHYCGRVEPKQHICPSCGSDKVRYSGQGTQRLEEELALRFPQVKILRMDADTTMSRYAYEEKFSAFGRGDYQLMIGTQMVAKGLDFPNVGLVGVLSADMSLFGDDFRSFETTFSLLTQVIGRAGRRSENGVALVQTFAPENEVIAQAAAQDYTAFYQTEIEARRLMGYPPYTDLYMFGFSGIREDDVKQAAQTTLQLLRHLSRTAFSDVKLIVLDPSPATITKIAGRYRYKLLIKTVNTPRLRELIGEVLGGYSRDTISKHVTVFVDVNPSALL